MARRKHAYVVNDLGYAKNLAIARGFIEKSGIVLCGRFAEWQYLNMDACARHAMETAAALREGRE